MSTNAPNNINESDEFLKFIYPKNSPSSAPPRPILSERPGITYQLEGLSFFKKRTIHTKQVFENGVWVEYDIETGKKYRG